MSDVFLIARPYNAADWYWVVGGDQTKVWSSARARFVDSADETYAAWAAHSQPTQISSIADLEDVLMLQYPAGSLNTYNPVARAKRINGGMMISGYPYWTDPVARNQMISAYEHAVANPGFITQWKCSDGTFVELTEAQLDHNVKAVQAMVQQCFACENTNQQAIVGGTITTIAQIDDAFNAIPVDVP